jgi:hypothetical protein
MESGTRRLDLQLLPLTHEVIEQVGASKGQRCFVADSDGKKFEKLRERLINQGDAPPHAQILWASLYDNLTYSPTREYERHECGEADFLGIKARVTLNAMDELLRQDSFGRPLSYVEIAIDGIERATDANSEGGLIDERWILTDEYDGPKSRVLQIQFHFIPSAVYEEKEPEPLLPTKADLLSLQEIVHRQCAETKRIRIYAATLCIIGALLLVLVLIRH